MALRRKPGERKQSGWPVGKRKYTSLNGCRLLLRGKNKGTAIITLPSGTQTTFRRMQKGPGEKAYMLKRGEGKGGEEIWLKIGSADLIVLKEFPVLRQFGWPV